MGVILINLLEGFERWQNVNIVEKQPLLDITEVFLCELQIESLSPIYNMS